MLSLRKDILELLIQNSFLTRQELEEITNIQRSLGEKFSFLLLSKNFIQKESLVKLINSNISLPRITASQLKITPEVLTVILPETAKEYNLLPLAKDGNVLELAIIDPLTILDLEEIEELREYTIHPVLGPEIETLELIERYYFRIPEVDSKSQSLDEILGAISETSLWKKDDLNLSEIAQMAQEEPIIKAVNFILEKAIELKASDMLVEPLEKVMRIRLRIDGILHQIETLPIACHPFVISRIKVIADLDISEHRFPQDGQFKMKLKNKEVEFRVSVIPSTLGEKAAVRILDKSLALLDIAKLGLREEALKDLKKVSLMPHGMILVCGPTGSGKTSTLYSILKFIHSPEKNIITVEDPVEYQLKGTNQVLVNSKTGLTFSRCLRAILRQDPNVIMIGEIRDFETVDIAIKAALTGHLVLSTLHTTTAVGSIVRLMDMGVEPFLISASVVAIISQRLARRICVNCKGKAADQPYFIGRGCKECRNSGYSGRILITEILYLSPEIKEAIVSEKLDEDRIKKLARSQGMKSLREEGEFFALAGITSLEEMLRVTPAD